MRAKVHVETHEDYETEFVLNSDKKSSAFIAKFYDTKKD